MSKGFKSYAVYYNVMLYQVIKCECGNKKVADPRGKPIQQILQQKWCPNCRKRGYWRSLSEDESRWD
ncbi:MAG: hypothetical protein ACTHKC_06175 [Candidatus Nitrosocosmicus sp.]